MITRKDFEDAVKSLFEDNKKERYILKQKKKIF